MKLTLKRAIASSLPLALLAGSTIAAGAAQAGGRQFFAPFGLPIAAAGPAVLGGGATLPVPAYLGKSVAGAYQSSGTSSFGVAGSIFGYFGSQGGGLSVEYCSTGSGKGKGVFDGVINTVDIPCSNAASTSTATTFGFLPPSGSPRQTYPSIAGTDAPLTQTDYSSYIADHPAPLEPVELPSIFGSIAILYHDNALNNPAHARIVLTDAQICGVYTGSIRTFGALLGNGDPTPIVPVYRKDGSGTSFNFSNHLQAACPALRFGVNQTFAAADSQLPASSFAATGNGGVLKEVIAQNGAIGYVEAGYVTNTPGGTGSPNYANVKNTRGVVLDPFAGLPAAANTVASSSLQTNVVVNQTTSGPATLSRLTGVRSGNCVKVVPPSAYANPSTGYPIIAVTYLLMNSAGNGTVGASALRLLERDLTTGSLFKHPRATTPITTVDEAEPFVTVGTTGYSSLGGTFSSTIQTTANTCINV